MRAAVGCCLLFVQVGMVFAQSSPEIMDNELSLGGIELDMTEAQVIVRHGKPFARIDDGEGVELRYRGLEIRVASLGDSIGEQDKILRVYEIAASSRKYCTPSGVCPGQPLKVMFERYGPTKLYRREHGDYYEYGSKTSPC